MVLVVELGCADGLARLSMICLFEGQMLVITWRQTERDQSRGRTRRLRENEEQKLCSDLTRTENCVCCNMLIFPHTFNGYISLPGLLYLD